MSAKPFKEWSSSMKLENVEGAEEAVVVATWADGWRHVVVDLSANEFKVSQEVQQAMAGRKNKGALFFVDLNDQEHLKVVRRQDRSALLVLVHKTKGKDAQICQVVLSKYSEEDALEVLKIIALEIKKGGVAPGDKQAIQKQRDELLATKGLSLKRPRSKEKEEQLSAKKRPAAQSHEEVQLDEAQSDLDSDDHRSLILVGTPPPSCF